MRIVLEIFVSLSGVIGGSNGITLKYGGDQCSITFRLFLDVEEGLRVKIASSRKIGYNLDI